MARKRLNLTLSEREFSLLEEAAERHKMTPHELAKLVLFQDIQKTEIAKFQRQTLRTIWAILELVAEGKEPDIFATIKKKIDQKEQDFFKLEG